MVGSRIYVVSARIGACTSSSGLVFVLEVRRLVSMFSMQCGFLFVSTGIGLAFVYSASNF